MLKKRKYKYMVMAAVLAGTLVLAGCKKKNVTYELEQNSNTVTENQTDLVDGATENSQSDTGTTEGNTDVQVSKEDSVGGISRDLGIPVSVDCEIDIDGTNLEKVMLADEDIRVPKRDSMYTAAIKNQEIDGNFKKAIAEALFDTESGIYVYPYNEHTHIKDNPADMESAVSMREVEAIFENGEAAGNYEADTYIGKIGDKMYTIFFIKGEGELSPSFDVRLLYDETITEEMKERFIEGQMYERSELCDYYYLDDESDMKQVNENMSSMDLHQAMDKAREFLYNIGIKDVMVERVYTLVLDSYTDTGYSVAQEFNGWYVDLISAVDEQPVYQPMAFGIDTLLKQEILYYVDETKYTVAFNDEGLVSMSVENPMINVDHAEKADELISWDEALTALENAICEVYKDYNGYRVLKFNDIRLTYFPIVDGESKKIIPVYAFAQVDTLNGSAERPIQLVMISALDGSYVDIVQDSSLANIKGADFSNDYFDNLNSDDTSQQSSDQE